MALGALGAPGNTTHTRGLVRRHGYLTDETVVIYLTGRIHSYARSPYLQSPKNVPNSEASPDDLGLALAHLDPTAKAILLNRHPITAVPRRTEISARCTRSNRSCLRRTLWRSSRDRFYPWSPSPNSATPMTICSYAEVAPVAGLAAELTGANSFRGIGRRTAPRRLVGARWGVHRSVRGPLRPTRPNGDLQHTSGRDGAKDLQLGRCTRASLWSIFPGERHGSRPRRGNPHLARGAFAESWL